MERRGCKQFVLEGIFDPGFKHRKVLVQLEEVGWACSMILKSHPIMIEAIFRSKDKDYMQVGIPLNLVQVLV